MVQNDYNLRVANLESENSITVSCLGIAVPIDLELKNCCVLKNDGPVDLN